MAEGGMSAGDVLALTKGNNGMFGDGIWGIIMLLIVAGLFSGNGFFGGNRAGVTEEYIANQFTQRDVFNTNSNVLDNKYASALGMADISKDVLENRYASQLCCCNTQKEILQNRYDNALAISGLQKDILLGNCDIKTAIAEDGEKTRALITANYQASLLEKINDLKAQVSNNEQTGYLLNTMGRWVGYQGCGSCSTSCGCSNLM